MFLGILIAELEEKEEEVAKLLFDNADLKVKFCDCLFEIFLNKIVLFKNQLREEQNSYDELSSIHKKSETSKTKELNEMRQKLSVQAKENDDLRKKVLELEQKGTDVRIGRFK